MQPDDTSPTPKKSEQDEPLGATEMFLQAFGSASKPADSHTDPLKPQGGETQPAGPGQTIAGGLRDGASSPRTTIPDPSVQTRPAPGEFTQLVQRLNTRPSFVPPAGPAGPPTQPHENNIARKSESGSQAPSESAPGDFTRIFLGSSSPSVGKTGSEQPPQAAAPSPAPAKGFSSPGGSDSVSGEGSFTELFKAGSPRPETPPAHVRPDPTLSPSAPIRAAKDPFTKEQFRPKPAETGSVGSPPMPSPTELLASLGSTKTSPPANKQPEVPPYRPAPPVSPPIDNRPANPFDSEAAGVTRFIQRLSIETPAPIAPPPTVAAGPPVSSDPGEFTRIISSSSLRQAEAQEAPVPARPAAPLRSS